MKFSALTLLLPSSLAAPALAQTVQVTGKTLTPFASVAQIGQTTTWDGVAKDTAFAPRKGISVSTKQQPTGMWASAYASAQVSSYVPMITLSERLGCRGTKTDGSGSSASPASTGATRGAHSVLGYWQGKPNERGILRVSFRCNVQYGTAASFNAASVDIGNDNSVEWKGRSSVKAGEAKEFPVQLDKNGQLVVKMTTESSVFGTGDLRDFVNCYQDLSLQYKTAEQGTCSVAAYGNGCGPKLDAAVGQIAANNVILWKLSGAFKNSFAVNVVGSQAIDLKLGLGCSLLSNAIVLTVVKTDANGEWSDSQIVPLKNFSSYHQSLPMDIVGNKLVIKASNGQKVTCTGF